MLLSVQKKFNISLKNKNPVYIPGTRNKYMSPEYKRGFL